ncbi:hypothetical protein [Pedobacter sp. GR22-6]|uniref:hypothetical protein n=1 Tax=Pedobacter sp. GR22-6 TaxID=3127957 RepID=UPI00307E6F1A
MENFEEFLKDLKNRLSNPLLLSFFISWCVWNWPIVVALVFYSHDEVIRDGYKSFFDIINQRQNTCKMIVWPALSSLVYTFAFPYLVSFIKLQNARISSKNDDDILKATKDDWMPVKKYMKLMERTRETSSQLKQLIENEEPLNTENVNLRAEISLLKENVSKESQGKVKAIDDLSKIIKDLGQLSVNGEWIEPAVQSNFIVNSTPYKFKISDADIIINDVPYKIDEVISNPMEKKSYVRISRSKEIEQFILSLKSDGSLLVTNSEKKYHKTLFKIRD